MYQPLRVYLSSRKAFSLSRTRGLPFEGLGCFFIFWQRGPESNRQGPFRDLFVFETNGLAYVPTPLCLVDDLDDLLAIIDDQDPGVFPESALKGGFLGRHSLLLQDVRLAQRHPAIAGAGLHDVLHGAPVLPLGR